MGKGWSLSSSRQIINYKDEQEVAPSKQNMRAACQKGKLEFKFLWALNYR